jgi:hypothetical protein
MSERQRNEWFVRIWLINYQYEIILSSSYFRLKVLQTRDHTNYGLVFTNDLLRII